MKFKWKLCKHCQKFLKKKYWETISFLRKHTGTIIYITVLGSLLIVAIFSPKVLFFSGSEEEVIQQVTQEVVEKPVVEKTSVVKEETSVFSKQFIIFYLLISLLVYGITRKKFLEFIKVKNWRWRKIISTIGFIGALLWLIYGLFLIYGGVVIQFSKENLQLVFLALLVIALFLTGLKEAIVPLVLTALIMNNAFGYYLPVPEVVKGMSLSHIFYIVFRYYMLIGVFLWLVFRWFLGLFKKERDPLGQFASLILIILIIIISYKWFHLFPEIDLKNWKNSAFRTNLQTRVSEEEKNFDPRGIEIPNDYKPPESTDCLVRHLDLDGENNFLPVFKGELILINVQEGINIGGFYQVSKVGKFSSVVNWDSKNLLYPKNDHQGDYILEGAPVFAPLFRLRHEYGPYFEWKPALYKGQKWLLVQMRANGFLEVGYNRPKKLFGAKDFTFNLLKGKSKLFIYRVDPEDLPD